MKNIKIIFFCTSLIICTNRLSAQTESPQDLESSISVDFAFPEQVTVSNIESGNMIQSYIRCSFKLNNDNKPVESISVLIASDTSFSNVLLNGLLHISSLTTEGFLSSVETTENNCFSFKTTNYYLISPVLYHRFQLIYLDGSKSSIF